jgi:hypothetical protein
MMFFAQEIVSLAKLLPEKSGCDSACDVRRWNQTGMNPVQVGDIG